MFISICILWRRRQRPIPSILSRLLCCSVSVNGIVESAPATPAFKVDQGLHAAPFRHFLF